MKFKLLLLSFGILLTSFAVSAQEYITRTGHISFYGKTSLETIEAENYQVSSILNSKTGDIIFSLINKSFEFKQALMQEHYNEKYMESDKYPKVTFKGKIVDLGKVNFSKDGTYEIEVEGDLTMHGATNHVKEKGAIVVKGTNITATSRFNVTPEDYKIVIPALVREKVAKTFTVNVDMNYTPKK